MQITSKNNSLIKELRLLKTTKGRKESGLFLVEGPHLVTELFNSNYQVEQLLVGMENSREDVRWLVELAGQQNIPLYELSTALLHELSATEQPQGVLAVARQNRQCSLSKRAGGENLMALIVDRVQDPGNLGVLIRTAWGFGASICLMTPGTVDLYNPKAIRATMGGLFHLDCFSATSEEIINWATQNGIRLYAGDARADLSLQTVVFPKRTGLIVGNEGNGLAKEWAGAVNLQYVSIPLPGRAESLNVATAAAIMFYEIVRQQL